MRERFAMVNNEHSATTACLLRACSSGSSFVVNTVHRRVPSRAGSGDLEAVAVHAVVVAMTVASLKRPRYMPSPPPSSSPVVASVKRPRYRATVSTF
jgi:hypothetical protein